MKPSVYQFGNYRSFLQALIVFERERGNFSFRKFAEKAGFKGQSFLKLVIDGKRNLSKEGARKIAEAFELNSREQKFFILLVEFNQTTNLDEQNELYQKLKEFVRAELVAPKKIDQYELYSNWYTVPLLETLSTEWSQPNLQFLASSLGLRDYQIKNAFGVLVRLGLAEESNKGYRRLESTLETPDSVRSLFVRNFHREMTLLAAEKISELPPELRELDAVTIPLSEENFEDLRRRLRSLRSDLLRLYANDQSAKKVYHVNLQCFPVLQFKE